MNRFFVEKNRIMDGQASIVGEDVGHIAKVLRLQEGDAVTLCDGACREYEARIALMAKDEVRLELISESASKTEPNYRVTLFQGLPKAGKLEGIIQKAVELGAFAIAPFIAKRSVAKPALREFEHKRARYQRVAMEAAKQSRRGIIPAVMPLGADLAALDLSGFDAIVLAYEQEHARHLADALGALGLGEGASIAVFIGPEGGFEPDEVKLLCDHGAVSVSLGMRILRTETAGMALLAMFAYALEGRG